MKSMKQKYNVSDKIKDEKKEIIRRNLNLPLHEIKKIIKQRYSNITNEELEELFSVMNREKSKDNLENNRQEEER